MFGLQSAKIVKRVNYETIQWVSEYIELLEIYLIRAGGSMAGLSEQQPQLLVEYYVRLLLLLLVAGSVPQLLSQTLTSVFYCGPRN